MEREEHDVRHLADGQHVLAEQARAFVLTSRADGGEVGLRLGDAEVAAQPVGRVEDGIERAGIVFEPEEHIDQYGAVPARAQGAADLRAARQRDVALHAEAAG